MWVLNGSKHFLTVFKINFKANFQMIIIKKFNRKILAHKFILFYITVLKNSLFNI